jgi:phosphatidylglycerophosphate synthase
MEGATATVASRRFKENAARLRSAQKPSLGTSAYGRYVNRPLGRQVAAFSHQFGLTPNAATAISASLSAAGMVLLGLAEPTWWSGLGVALLLAAGYVMDSVDGQLARLRGGGSIRGEWLDHSIDAIKTSSLHLVVAISWFRFPPTEGRAWLLVPLAFSVVQTVTYFELIVLPFLRKSRLVGSSTVSEHPLRRWILLLTDYGTICWIFVLLAAQRAFMAVYTTMMLLGALTLAFALVKWWRELGALDSKPLPRTEVA